ncbi:MAG: XrtA/PEP-CTERM system histidine kinase PrsK [Limisphaerales bacterium]
MTSLTSIGLTAALLSGGLALAAVAALARRRASPMFLSFAAGMAVLAGECLLAVAIDRATTADAVTRWHLWRQIVGAFLPGPWLIFSLTFSRGNYREFLQRWRWSLGLAGVVPLLLALALLDLINHPFTQPLPAPGGIVPLSVAGKALQVALLMASVAILSNLERTLRASIGTMRWRIKYLVLGVGLIFGVRVYTTTQALLYSALSPTLQLVETVAVIVAVVAIGFSLARSRLREVDVYPSTTFLSHSVTLVLAGVYLVVVGVLARVVAMMGGDAAFPLKAFVILVAMVGLTALVLSERLRQRIRTAVSRHLRRPRHDYRTVWSSFMVRTTPLMEESQLCREVARWVSDTFQLLSVSVWTVDPVRNRLTLSSSTVHGEEAAAGDAGEMALSLYASLSRPEPVPVNLETVEAEWARALRQAQPGQFRGAGPRFAMPLVAGGELLGMLVVGDRVASLTMEPEDLELLSCAGNQIASSLLKIRLAQQLLAAREMETLQTMATFFVHDLKNVATSLSLTVRNLPTHFHNPEFREDALRGLTRISERLTNLIGTFNLLRGGSGLNCAATDLTEVVKSALATVSPGPEIRLRRELETGIAAHIDGAQVQKVVTNLILNAIEALGKGGEVRVATGREKGMAVLTVADDGCGMPAGFLKNSLFRPFQTTKPKGLGIGLFHCRRIVEAHRGRIEVESQPGEGTVFRVYLPVAP